MAEAAQRIGERERLPAYTTSGAEQLARQPLTAKEPAPNDDWNRLFSHHESRLGMLRSWRYSWWVSWAEYAEWTLPKRYLWLVTANTMNRGWPMNSQIMDGTPTQAMEICAAGMQEGLMSASKPWLRLGPPPGVEADAAAKLWFEDAGEKVLTVFGESNFYNVTAQAFQDVATFGTAPVIMYEDEQDVIRAYGPCAGEYYLGSSGRLDDDTLYREFTYTVSQIVDFFGLDACPDQVQKLWRTGGGSLEMEFVVAHAIEPNFPIDDGKGDKGFVPVKGGFPWRETYWLRGIKTNDALSKRGFREKPFFIMRWKRVANDAYGSGHPCSNAIGDQKQLQEETRRKAEFLQKGVRPPMGADPAMKNEPSSILPGNITYFSTDGGKKGFFPLFEVNAGWLAPLSADIGLIQQRIERFYFTDVFMLFQNLEGVQPRNEMEIAERKGEKIQRLGPMIGLFETEAAAPAIRRCLAILARAKLLMPLPPSLKGIIKDVGSIRIEYVSMMKLAQRAAETAAVEQGFSMAGKLSEAAKAAGLPDPARIVNGDEAFRSYLEMVAFPARGIYSPDQVAKMDAAKAQAAQQQKEAADVETSVKLAGQLGKIDVGSGQNAISALLGNGGGAPAAGSGL